MKRQLLIVAAAAAITSGLLLGRQAHALRELTRSHAYGCAALSGASHFGAEGEINAVPSNSTTPTGAANTSTEAKGKFACAIDDSNQLATAITWVNVHMQLNAPGGGGWAVACTQFMGQVGGSCAAGKQSTTTSGGKVISLITNWPEQAVNGFPYVYVEIPSVDVQEDCGVFTCTEIQTFSWLRGYTAGNLTTLQPTRNIYRGSDWWGEIGVTNKGSQPLSNFVVAFTLPAGVHCNDYVPPGATLGPLSAGGLSAGTVSNYCRFTWANTTIAPGAQFVFNYSTDSQNFSSVDNIITRGGQSNATCMPMIVVSASYDGPDWWGTIKIKNNGTLAVSKYSVEFDVPSGAHCTNDYVPPGATLTPLSSGGLSQGTVSNHCVFTWSNANISPGATYTFNYSTDTQSSAAPANVIVTDLTCPANGA